MAVQKLSVSFDEEVGQVVKAAAEREGISVSAWLSEAAESRIRNEYLRHAVQAKIEEHALDRSDLERALREARSESGR